MGLGFVGCVEGHETEDPDGGPTELLVEASTLGDRSLFSCSDKDLALSLVSLNAKTAETADFARGALLPWEEEGGGDSIEDASIGISCGRGCGNTIVLEDPRVSLHHFTIRCAVARGGRGGGGCQGPPPFTFELVDESSNGTYLNDRPVGKGRRVPLTEGDRVFVLPSARVGQQAAIGYAVVVGISMSQVSLQKRSGAASSQKLPPQGPDHASQLAASVRCRLCANSLIHRCVTIVPCGHNFCLGCTLMSCRTSPLCPECERPIRQAVRNHSVDNVVETIVREMPEEARSESSLQRLNEAEQDPRSAALMEWLFNGRVQRAVAEQAQAGMAAMAGAVAETARSAEEAATTYRPGEDQAGTAVCVVS